MRWDRIPWVIAAFALSGWAAEFTPPERITGGDAKYQLSRTASHVMALDSGGRLHIVFWQGGVATTPTTPSFVYYRNWSFGWSPKIALDNSAVGSSHLGGRHPSLVVTDDDDVFVVWHDHRHCTAAGNWIDNVEIYGDLKPANGTFSPDDIRLTNSSAPHPGDNSYTPKVAKGPDGRLSLLWYDYNADRNTSDLYLNTSDTAGVFNGSLPMASYRITDAAERGGGPSFTVPDIAVDGNGTRHLAWAGGLGPGVNLYYAEAPEGASHVTEQLLAAGATDFFDPPHIEAAPNGDVWVVYGDDSALGGEDIFLRRRRDGQPSFDPPVTIAADPARQYAPDIEVDALGMAHLVWIDNRGGAHVEYAVYDPNASLLSDEQALTPGTGPWARPALLLDSEGGVYVLWEEDISVSAGDIWFTTTKKPVLSSVENWTAYH
jgi:hypothetical protein